MKEKPISKAVIPVAGYGTRLLPAVSYTHLDVYKRQGENEKRIKG